VRLCGYYDALSDIFCLGGLIRIGYV